MLARATSTISTCRCGTVFKPPVEEAFADKPLIDWFAELPRGETRLGAAGKLMSAADCRRLLDARRRLRHPRPRRRPAPRLPEAATPPTPTSTPIALPVTARPPAREGLSPAFIEYMNGWKGFVAQEEAAEAAA